MTIPYEFYNSGADNQNWALLQFSEKSPVWLTLAYSNRIQDIPLTVYGYIYRTNSWSTCTLLCVPVPNSKERRTLESSSSEHVKLALEACFTDDRRCVVATQQHIAAGYVCKKCFILVDKKVRMEGELEKVKIILKDKVSRNVESFVLPERTVSKEELRETPTVQSGVKRTSASSTVPAPKRPRMDKPMQGQSVSVKVC